MIKKLYTAKVAIATDNERFPTHFLAIKYMKLYQVLM